MLAEEKLYGPEISIQSTQLRSDPVVPVNPATELCWRSLPEASNAEGKTGSSVVRKVMSGPTSPIGPKPLGT